MIKTLILPLTIWDWITGAGNFSKQIIDKYLIQWCRNREGQGGPPKFLADQLTLKIMPTKVFHLPASLHIRQIKKEELINTRFLKKIWTLTLKLAFLNNDFISVLVSWISSDIRTWWVTYCNHLILMTGNVQLARGGLVMI